MCHAVPLVGELRISYPLVTPNDFSNLFESIESGVDCRMMERRLGIRSHPPSRNQASEETSLCTQPCAQVTFKATGITHIADGQTIAYSVSADEVSVSSTA